MSKKRPTYPRQKRAPLRWSRVFAVILLLAGMGTGIAYFSSGSEEAPSEPAPKPVYEPKLVDGKRVLPGETVTPLEPVKPVDPHLAQALKAREKQQAAQGNSAVSGKKPTQADTAPIAVVPQGKSLQQITAEMATHRFVGKSPQEWGEHVDGVTRFLSHVWEMREMPVTQRHGVTPQKTARPPSQGRKTIALTLDACGGRHGSSYDDALIAFLRARQIPATLFVTTSWIKKNPLIAQQLAHDALFELAAHGTSHKPASIEGREAYGIKGTRSLAELVKEVEANAREIEALTGKKPRWYRSGTAYYDDIAVAVIRHLGYGIAGYSIAADQGATLRASEVAAAASKAQDGDILLLHMNKPESGTREGLMQALPLLQEQGFVFVRLSP